jgi:hypothetical protein
MRRLPAAISVAATLAACGSDPAASETRPASDDTTPASPPVDTSEAADVTPPPPPPPPWRLAGDVTVAPPKAPVFPLFVERTAEAFPEGVILGNGRAMVVDFDGDGRDDIVAIPTDTSVEAPSTPRLLRNTTEPDGAWSFEDATAASGMAGASMAILIFGDVDNDGDMDAFSGTTYRTAPATPALWRNDGAGHFTREDVATLLPHRRTATIYKEMAAGTLADFDRDGFLDLYLGMFNDGDLNTNYYAPSPDELYRGDGTGGFTFVPLPDQHNPLTSQVEPDYEGMPRRTYGVCPADHDDDGDLDLFVNNYGAGRPAMDSPPLYWDWNLLWRNDGQMNMTDVGVESGVHATPRGIGGVEEERPLVMGGRTYPGPIGGNGFGCHWGDFDNDGDLDLIVGTIAHPDYKQSDRTLLHVNPGGAPGSVRAFSEESAARGLEYYEDELHAFFIDLDLDGRLDLAVSRLRGGSKQEFYLQGSDQRFARQTWANTGVDIERPGPTLWLDVDGDGDLDFFMPQSATGRLFENRGAQNAWLTLDLVARAPRDATGARVTLRSFVGTQMREVIGGSGHYNTQQGRTVMFGLGGDSGAREVTIRWPDGEVQVLGDVRTNVALKVVQGGEITLLSGPPAAP